MKKALYKGIYFGPLGGYWSKGCANPLLTIYRFRILLCPVWMLGYQAVHQPGHRSTYLLALIPPLAFEWQGGRGW